MPSIKYFLCLTLLLILACENPEDDFTSGTFYPVEPTIPPEKEEEQNTTNPPIPNPQNCWDEGIVSKHNRQFNDYFTRYEDGWTGGDATYSIPISEGVNLWIFGDTFLGIVRSDRSRPSAPLINNTFVWQEGENFTTFHGGTATAPKAFIEPPEADWWYWPGHGQVHNGQLQVFLFALRRTNDGGQFGFEYTAIDIATYSLPDLTLVDLSRKMDFQGTNFGACLLQSNGYTYIYGAEKIAFSKRLHVARVKGTDLHQSWEYYKGDDKWSTEVTESKAIFASVSEQFSVIERPEGFYLMTQNFALGKELYLYKSNLPAGTFEEEQILYCTPESNEGLFTYNAFVHEQFSTADQLLISYNVNSRIFADLFKNADTYRPYFVNIEGWR